MAQTATSDFHPFKLVDSRETEWADVRISFDDWDWLKEKYGDEFDDYSFNGYGIQGLVFAARVLKGLPAASDTMDPNSETSTCYIHFKTYEEAIETIKIAFEMINSKRLILKSIKVARNEGFDEW